MYSIEEIYKYTKDLKILYIEDDIYLSKEMKEVLENFFKKVVLASDGQKGIEVYKIEQFDIVITDIKMPNMDGIEMAKKIKEINSEQDIIVISAYNDSDKLFALIKIGISDFILKPMDFNQVLNVLYKISKNIVSKKLEKEYILEQEKFAQIGKMLDMIAHQWLQYVHLLNIKAEMIQIENNSNNLNQEKIDNYMKECREEIASLDNILSEFRVFLNQNKKEVKSIKYIVESSIILLKDYLLKHLVKIDINVDEFLVNIYPNQFKQVILNIIVNMVEAFEQRNIKDRQIKIYNKNNLLFIEDNAGGIKEEYIDKIFDENFTTKSSGTGKGLYLSKLIMERINGTISVKNIENGARFILKVENGD